VGDRDRTGMASFEVSLNSALMSAYVWKPVQERPQAAIRELHMAQLWPGDSDGLISDTLRA
jgi:hypothetical protein